VSWRQVGRVVAAFIGTAVRGRRIILDGGGDLAPISEIQLWTGNETPSQYPAVIREWGGGTGFNEFQELDIWAPDMGNIAQLPGITLESYPQGSPLGRPTATLYGDVVNVIADEVNINGISVSADGIFIPPNMAWGSVLVTPVANTPTSVTVSGLDVAGTQFVAFVTAMSGVPGSTVLEVSALNPTSSSVDVVIYRTNNTQTRVYWQVLGS
jgi:hypothetical protein